MPHSSHAISTTSRRATVNTLACLRAFPRLRKHTLAAVQPPSSQGIKESIIVSKGYHGLAVARRPGVVGVDVGFVGRRWAGSAVAVAVKEEDELEDSVSGGSDGGRTGLRVQEVGNAHRTRTRSRKLGVEGMSFQFFCTIIPTAAVLLINFQVSVTDHHPLLGHVIGSSLSRRNVQDSLSALDDQNLPPQAPGGRAKHGDFAPKQVARYNSRNDQPSSDRTKRASSLTHGSPSETRNRSTPSSLGRSAATLPHAAVPPTPRAPTHPQIDSIIHETEQILDRALLSATSPFSRHNNSDDGSASGREKRNLPWPVRHLRLRTVRSVDVEHAENAFHQARQRLARVDFQTYPRNNTHRVTADEGTIAGPGVGDADADRHATHKEVLRAHINHLLYLSARIPDPAGYTRIMAYLREYELEPDGWTWLTRLVLVDKAEERVGGRGVGFGVGGAGNVVRQLEGVCREFNSRIEAESVQLEDGQGGGEEGEEKITRRKQTIDRDNATVLLNMTIWILAKRGQWSIVGPAYNNLLARGPLAAADRQPSSAFPPEYFTPSHDLSSFHLCFHPTTSLNKITYQSLIRALAFHGNIVPALAVMQDMMNDERGYTVGVSDFVSLFQGFARFGTIPVGWEGVTAESTSASAGDVGYMDTGRSLRPDGEDDEYAPLSPQRDFFPPPIFPEPRHPGPITQDRSSSSSSSSKTDAIQQMTEIWAGNIGSSAWDGAPSDKGKGRDRGNVGASGLNKLEREWTLVTLQQVFHSFLASSPNPPLPNTATSTTSSSDSTIHRKYWDSSPAEAPSPRNIYYIMLAFARTTNRNREVLRAVWKHLEGKFGEENEEGWLGWRLDARLRRMREWLGVAK
ncbi:hypothetical protein QFC21_000627 [Naganishia friedmannii]|uniref:Uncharacterized protein n=1 Tax=Naganishia friedmannii TaxID=89922 RepID=A0ACC2WC22_9TREE|nr:hypothetical protein QFC21_000627 [Naganishia friedmannii]